ncbi:serine/threonine-protein phosphatase, partial [Streptomyces sp. SID13666]|uniref:PP2C family protein-serine/threonine phosphatase n=1 Tax=Streptomyces sp. SID13666 TaxID=2706054 RepID=UPI0013BFC3CB
RAAVGHGATGGDRVAGGATGATCLYAVYDPVSRELAVASAGHPPPVLVLPDGGTQVVDVSVGPVLVVGGLPFETTEIQLPEGSLVALFTDGLVEPTEGDPDLGIALLARTLADGHDAHASLEDRCDRVLSALLPKNPGDDVALVLARTRALDAGHV